jgi:hypothetical protein
VPYDKADGFKHAYEPGMISSSIEANDIIKKMIKDSTA